MFSWLSSNSTDNDESHNNTVSFLNSLRNLKNNISDSLQSNNNQSSNTTTDKNNNNLQSQLITNEDTNQEEHQSTDDESIELYLENIIDEYEQKTNNNNNDEDIFIQLSMEPTVQRYPLQAAVINKDENALIHAISLLPDFQKLCPFPKRPINLLDHHGYNALHLAVLTAWEKGVDILIEAGASPTTRSRAGWSSMQECISTSQRNILRKLFRRNMRQVQESLSVRAPIIRSKLCEKKDFYMEINWKFSSWIPFVSRFCPSDTFKIWKRGSDFRIDITLVDFKQFRWERGHLSFIMKMNDETGIVDLYVLNHFEKTLQITNKSKEFASTDQNDIEEHLEMLLQSELMSPEVLSDKIVITRTKTWLGYPSTTTINDIECDSYQLSNLIVLINKRENHVPEEVKKDREKHRQLLQSSVNNHRSSIISNKVNVNLITTENINNNKPIELQYFDEEEHRKSISNVDINLNYKNINGMMDDIKEESNTDNIENSENLSPRSLSNMFKNFLNPKEYESNTNSTENSYLSSINNNNSSNVNNDSSIVSDDVCTNDTYIAQSHSSPFSEFAEIKKYEYEDYIPPIVSIDDYFNAEEWRKRKKIRKNKRFNGVKSEIRNERKETFVINPAIFTSSTKSFKLNLAMIDDYYITIEETVAMLEAVAPQSKLAAKLKDFLEISMPPGFPIQLELPLWHVLKATVTFQNFQYVEIADDVFYIPEDYELVDKESKNGSKFHIFNRAKKTTESIDMDSNKIQPGKKSGNKHSTFSLFE